MFSLKLVGISCWDLATLNVSSLTGDQVVPAHGSFTHYCNLKIMVHGALVARQTVGQGAVPGSNPAPLKGRRENF